MRSLAFGWAVFAAVLGLAFGCGQSEGDSATPGGAGTSTTTAGSSSAGMSGTSATAGTANGGSSNSGASHGGSAAGGGGASTTGGQPDAQAGTSGDGGGAGGLVDCDPKKIFCRRVAPTCGAGEVPSVDGTCYGECVKVEQCGCSAADQCPEPEQYTCWAKQHCGPFVQ